MSAGKGDQAKGGKGYQGKGAQQQAPKQVPLHDQITQMENYVRGFQTWPAAMQEQHRDSITQRVVAMMQWISQANGQGQFQQYYGTQMARLSNLYQQLAPPMSDYDCPKAERFKKMDRALCRVDENEKGPVWMPGKILEVDLEDPEDPQDTFPYGVGLDEKCVPPFGGRMITAPVDDTNVIRAETCFGEAFARHACMPLSSFKKLRFGVGAEVVCRVDSKRNGTGKTVRWESGTVAATRVPVKDTHKDYGAAYKITISEGDLKGEEVYASRDEHWLIREKKYQDPGESTESCPTRFEKQKAGNGWVKFDHTTTRSCKWDSDDSDDSD